MSTVELEAEQWRKILKFLQGNPKVYVSKPKACKRFIEGVLWMTRSGAQWRLLPKEYGHWNSVYKRFDRWSQRGIWDEMFKYFANDPDMERVMIDSTIIRAHASAAGAPKAKGGKRSRRSATAVVGSAANFTSSLMR